MKANYLQYLGVFAVLAFLFNFVWEALHGAYLYWYCFGEAIIHLAPRDFVWFVLEAAVLDMLILTLIILIGRAVFLDRNWFLSMNKKRWSYLVGAAIITALLIEVGAVYLLAEWSYSQLMPTLFGIGVSPLFQLLITALMSIGIIKIIKHAN
jgi:hypothetical protein